MSNPATALKTRVGRFLWGNLYKKVTEDYDGNPLPENKQYYEIGLAIEKKGEASWWLMPEGAIIFQVGSTAHPHSYQRPDFSWKVTDGDSATPGKPKNGKPGRAPKDKEGFPGHWVLHFRTTLDIKMVNEDGSAYLLDRDAIRPGDYVQIFGDCVGNTGATPGVYLNPRIISLQWKGKPIVNGPDPKSLGFGGEAKPAGFQAATGVTGFPVPGGLPVQGAVSVGAPAGTVVAASVGLPGALPGAAGGAPAPGPIGAPAVLPGASPAQTSLSNGTPTAVQPHPGFLTPKVGLLPAPAAPAVPVVPVVAELVLSPTLAAQGVTWQAMLAQGWTTETARQAGHVVG